MKPLLALALVIALAGCTSSRDRRNAVIAEEAKIQRERNSQFMKSFQRYPRLMFFKTVSTSSVEGRNPNAVRIGLNQDYKKLSPEKKALAQKQIADLWFAAVRAGRIRDDKAEVEFIDSAGKPAGIHREK